MKKIIMFLLIALISFNAICCSKPGTEKDKIVESKENEIPNTTEEETEAETEEETEAVPEVGVDSIDFSIFVASEEIKNSSPEDVKIQVADMILEHPVIVSEIINKVEASELEWEYEYNPDALAVYNNANFLSFSYHGVEIFNISYNNLKSDESTISVKDCAVTNITFTDIAIENENIASGIYYAGGYGIAGKNIPDYATYITELDANDRVYEQSGTDKIVVSYKTTFSVNELPSLGITFSTYGGPRFIWYQVTFDASTGQATRMSHKYAFTYLWQKIAN